jgi:hypothetical protein
MKRAEIMEKLNFANERIAKLEHDMNNALQAKRLLEQLLEVYDARTSNSQG